MRTTPCVAATLLVLCLSAGRAFADATAEARAVDEGFGQAVYAGDVAAALAFYADDATAIYPGAGEEGTGKAGIEKLLSTFPKKAKLIFTDNRAFSIDDTHIMNINHWEFSAPGPHGKPMVMKGRSSELLVKGVDGRWRYLVDHASVGLPPPPPPKPKKARTHHEQ